MRVAEVARKSGVNPHTVRYRHKLGLLSSRRDPSNRYRRFGASAVERLRFVARAKDLGFSLAEVREILEMSHDGKSPCPRVRDIVRERIAENARRIAALGAAGRSSSDRPRGLSPDRVVRRRGRVAEEG